MTYLEKLESDKSDIKRKYFSSPFKTRHVHHFQLMEIDEIIRIHKRKLMSDFKKRLDTEFEELDERIIKLKSFLDGDKITNIDKDQLTLLGIQLQAMETYRSCLTARISRLDNKDREPIEMD